MFRKLLGMVPRLEERLMECTDDDAMGIADLVRVFDCIYTTLLLITFVLRSKKVSPARGQMTPKV